MNTVKKWKEQLAGKRYMRNKTRKEEMRCTVRLFGKNSLKD
jgi:hypothetical protein